MLLQQLAAGPQKNRCTWQHFVCMQVTNVVMLLLKSLQCAIRTLEHTRGSRNLEARRSFNALRAGGDKALLMQWVMYLLKHPATRLMQVPMSNIYYTTQSQVIASKYKELQTCLTTPKHTSTDKKRELEACISPLTDLVNAVIRFTFDNLPIEQASSQQWLVTAALDWLDTTFPSLKEYFQIQPALVNAVVDTIKKMQISKLPKPQKPEQQSHELANMSEDDLQAYIVGLETQLTGVTGNGPLTDDQRRLLGAYIQAQQEQQRREQEEQGWWWWWPF